MSKTRLVPCTPKTARIAPATGRKGPRPSLRMAINNFCRECIYDTLLDTGWRAQVKACPDKGCPIYRVRPGR